MKVYKKRDLVNCLYDRAWRICSDYALFHQEILFIHKILKANGYPVTFLDSCLQKFLSRKYTKKEELIGPKKKTLSPCPTVVKTA